MEEVSLNRELIAGFLSTARQPSEYRVLDRIDTIVEESKKFRSYKAHQGYSP